MKAYVILILRVTAGMVFVAAGAGKLLDISAFSLAVERFDILPLLLILPFTVLVPIIEVTLGLAFIIGRFVKTAGYGLSAILMSFLAAIGLNLAKGNPTSCGCFGVLGSDTISLHLFFKDIGLLLSTLFLSFQRKIDIETVPSLNRKPLQVIALYGLSASISFLFFWSDKLATTLKANALPQPITRKQTTSLISYGSKAPSFVVNDINGVIFTETDFRGNTTLLIFFSPQTIRNRSLASALQYCSILNDRYFKHGFRVYGIFEGRRKEAIEQATYFQLTFSITADSIGAMLQIFGIPKGASATVMIDKEGIVRYTSLGVPIESLLRQLVEKELFGTPLYVGKKHRNTFAMKEGDTFPNVHIEDIDTRQQMDLFSMVNSYAVVMYFSSNCGCRNENKGIGILNRVSGAFAQARKDISIFGIFGTRYTPEQLRKYRETARVKFRAYLTTDIISPEQTYLAQDNVDPLIIIVDRQQHIKRVIDVSDDESIAVDRILSFITSTKDVQG